MTEEQREREARELRVEISRLNEARGALEGLVVVGDPWAELRLGEVEAAIGEKSSRLFDLMPGTNGRETA